MIKKNYRMLQLESHLQLHMDIRMPLKQWKQHTIYAGVRTNPELSKVSLNYREQAYSVGNLDYLLLRGYN
jgi:hypothetical protein